MSDPSASNIDGRSWGRYPHLPPNAQRLVKVTSRHADLPVFEGTGLPHGIGRSYGDSNLNPGGSLLIARSLDRFISFDATLGILRCESGVTLAEILEIVLPQGWFLPVTPGTRYVTVGGAIANDVHGKNHRRAGSFGLHVRELELLRSDGTRQKLLPSDILFSATIGGLGLTGLITYAELQLSRIAGPWLETETIRYDSLDDFFTLSKESLVRFEYTVAWLDCLASGRHLGRGHFIRANHVSAFASTGSPSAASRRSIPFVPPIPLVNSLTLRPFNSLYYWRQLQSNKRSLEYYQKYFYPLDSISHWNRMYGPKGFLQYQCVLPPPTAQDAVAELLREISCSGNGSFLAVLKEFGDRPALGMLSFPRAGTTFALDFRNDGESILKLLGRLDCVVSEAGGAIYPAKDARMSGKMFRAGYPRWLEFSEYIDPRFSSGFWRRVMQ